MERMTPAKLRGLEARSRVARPILIARTSTRRLYRTLSTHPLDG